MFDKEKIMDQVSKDMDEIQYGDIKIEKRGENKPVDVVSTKRIRIEPTEKYKENLNNKSKTERREG